jgi:hypothetical protein
MYRCYPAFEHWLEPTFLLSIGNSDGSDRSPTTKRLPAPSASCASRAGHSAVVAVTNWTPGRVRSFHPAPPNRAGSHSKSIRNRSVCPVVGQQSRNPAAVGNNTAPWQVRGRQGRLRQRSQRLRVFSLYALCCPPLKFRATLIVSRSRGLPQCLSAASRRPGLLASQIRLRDKLGVLSSHRTSSDSHHIRACDGRLML